LISFVRNKVTIANAAPKLASSLEKVTQGYVWNGESQPKISKILATIRQRICIVENKKELHGIIH
jgi:hypothetical protein